MFAYAPSDRLVSARQEYETAVQAAEEKRAALRAATADDIAADPSATNEEVAEHLPWSGEIVRQIRAEAGLPSVRPRSAGTLKARRPDRQGNRTAAYRRIAAGLRTQIADGTLPVGSPLPTTEDLAKRHKVSTKVAADALNLLRDEGLVVRERGKGTFVKAVPQDAGAAQ